MPVLAPHRGITLLRFSREVIPRESGEGGGASRKAAAPAVVKRLLPGTEPMPFYDAVKIQITYALIFDTLRVDVGVLYPR
jgi:hypothetical protein